MARRNEANEFISLSVRQNGVWSLAGNCGFAACQLGILVVMARLGTPEHIGRYALGLAIASPIFLLFSLQLRTLLASHVSDELNFSVYFSVRLVTVAAAMATAAVIGWIFLPPHTTSVVLALSLSKVIDALHDLVYGLYWRLNRMDYIAKSMLVRGIAGLSAFAIAFYLTVALVASILALCATWLAVFVVYDLRVVQMLSPSSTSRSWGLSWSPAMVRRIIWLGFPAGVLSWLVSLHTYIPRFFLQHGLGETALGVFTALAYLFVGLETCARSFNHAAVPHLAKFAANGQADALRQLVRKLSIFGIILSALVIVGCMTLGRTLVLLIYGSTYAQHTTVFTILACGFAIRTATMPTAMTLRAINAFWALLGVQLLAILGLSAACAVLVPSYGIYGCASACVIGFVIDAVGRTALHHFLVMRPAIVTGMAAEFLQAA